MSKFSTFLDFAIKGLEVATQVVAVNDHYNKFPTATGTKIRVTGVMDPAAHYSAVGNIYERSVYGYWTLIAVNHNEMSFLARLNASNSAPAPSVLDNMNIRSFEVVA